MASILQWFGQNWNAGWFFGQVIAIIVAVIVLRLSSRDLRAEAANLRFLIKLVLDALEHEGLAKVNRDKDGFPTGIVLSIKASPGKLILEGQPPEVIESSSK